MSGCILVRVTEARGSVPRGPGTTMQVWTDGQSGTIGGGALEWEATQIAREMLRSGRRADRRSVPLGPALGQCCGGHVVLEFLADATPEPVAGQPLWVWGAGHVGRAIVAVLAPLPDFAITWVDTAAERFPPTMPETVAPLVAAAPARAMRHAPRDACHLIVSYSHDIDLALCDAALRHEFRFCGVIGSQTKWARFRKRLSEMGHGDAEIARITCPIGTPELGKHPQAIAVGVAGQLLRQAAHAGASGTGGI